MILRRSILQPAVLIGFIVSLLVLAVHFSLIKKQGKLVPAHHVMDELENVLTKEYVSEKTQFQSPVIENMFRLYDGVETFVLFIGYPRSSHSLVGAVLDAHPEIIIPHEYNLLGQWDQFRTAIQKQRNLEKYFLFYELHQLSTRQATFGLRAKTPLFTRVDSPYKYNVPGLWQGGYCNRIRVIGDKKGDRTSLILSNADEMVILDEISDVVQVPIKFIHVVRNPFDNIATILLQDLYARHRVRTEEAEKVNNTIRLNWAIDYYFKLAASNQRVRERYGEAVIDILGHETVLRPRETIQKLCGHLGVICSEVYIEKCSNILYATPSITRDKIVWTDEQKTRVTKMMKNFPFLKDYSFEEYPH